MDLRTVKHFIWKSGGDLTLHYRQKSTWGPAAAPFVTLHIQSTRSPALPVPSDVYIIFLAQAARRHACLSRRKQAGEALTDGWKTRREGRWLFLKFERSCMFYSFLTGAVLSASELFWVFGFSSSHLTFQWCVCCQWRHQIPLAAWPENQVEAEDRVWNWSKTITSL